MSRRTGPKIVMVGGGSYKWCPRLLSDLFHEPQMDGSEVVLLDPNQAAAGEVEAAGRTMAQTLGRRFRLRSTKSEASAFRDADFVLITISTGDLAMMKHDIEIPEQYGIFATVGDTVGPGGWSRSLRNVPVFVHLARKIERYSPNAVILNYTNPMSTLTSVIHRVSGLRCVGLCHGPFANLDVLQRLFGVEEEDLAVNFAGVNHFFWFLDFTVRGEPGYPLLRKRLQKQTLGEALSEGTRDGAGWHTHHALCDELLRGYGYLPFVADRHTCEFFPHYITGKVSRLRQWGLQRTSVKERERARARDRRRTLRLAAGKEAPPARSRETAVDIMNALANNKPFFDVVNLPNTGQIENLPRGAVVETLGRVDALGFRALSVGSMPEVLANLVRPHCRVQELTVQAALEGDREAALQALLVDPQCAHLPAKDVRSMGEELMRATSEWLPRFQARGS